ncbi:MAG: Hsp33 family molecular chaperone HslO [Bacillota bacterium]
MPEDYLVHAVGRRFNVRGYAALTTELVNKLGEIHRIYPTALAALGRLATAGAMLGAMLKDSERLSIQLKGDGPVGRLIVDADPQGHVRGYIQNPQVHLPPQKPGKLDVGRAVGRDGFLTVVKDLGLKEPYYGSIPLVTGEVADDLAAYFHKSEQIPSGVGLGVLVNPDGSVQAAGGFIVQTLPGFAEQEIRRLEQGLSAVKSVTEFLRTGVKPENLLEMIYPGEFEVTARQEIIFQCRCNKDKLADALASLGYEELQSLAQEGNAEIICNFCNSKYLFSAGELDELLKRMKFKEGN